MSVKTFLVDLRIERQRKNFTLLSDFLVTKIHEILTEKKQAMLLLNKRGHSSSILCTSCGQVAQCHHCDLPLTLHLTKKYPQGILICHLCGHMETPRSTCSFCQSSDILPVGWGTQKVEELLRIHFPEARILRVDTDTMRSKDAYTELHRGLTQHEFDIVIGTQIIAKGLDLPQVSLVAVLNADVGMSIPDFRASERMFQLVTQLVGRVGRRSHSGTVVIQSFNPESPVLSLASQSKYEEMYTEMMKERMEHGYPPASEFILLSITDMEPERAMKRAKALGDALEIAQKDIAAAKDVEMYVAPAFFTKQQGKYRYHVTLKGNGAAELLEHITIPRDVVVDREPLMTV